MVWRAWGISDHARDRHVSAFVRCMSMGFPKASENKPGIPGVFLRGRARARALSRSLSFSIFLSFSLSIVLSHTHTHSLTEKERDSFFPARSL
jgi:hypothetical protein